MNLAASSRMIVVLVVMLGLLAVLPEIARGYVAPSPKPSLHLGSCGRRVADLEWLLAGHKPTAYSSIRTYSGPKTRCYTRAVGRAVRKMKYRIGWPQSQVDRTAGWLFVAVLKGQVRRPVQWIAAGARRQAAFARVAHRITTCETRIVRIAESQIGVVEIPNGSNRGPGISYPTAHTSPSFQSATGAYGLAWCASFAQWVLDRSRYGAIASRSAYVPYIWRWGYNRHLLRSSPSRGALVLFLSSSGHIGIVENPHAVHNGAVGFTSIEGNWSNRVARVFHPYSRYAIAFLYLPHCSPSPRGRTFISSIGSDLGRTNLATIIAGLLIAAACLFSTPPHHHLRARRARKKAGK